MSYPKGSRRPEDMEDVGALPSSALQHLKGSSPLQSLARNRSADPGPVAHQVETTKLPTPRRPRTTAEERHKPSTAQVPVRVVELVSAHRTKTAIDALYEQLPRLLRDQENLSSAGFRTRELVPGAAGEPKATFAFRMTTSDFARLDVLVDELGARNRTHLIVTALLNYLTE
jgi:predicted acylesterase/phospholipase RssA